jgi:hypothetical protein
MTGSGFGGQGGDAAGAPGMVPSITLGGNATGAQNTNLPGNSNPNAPAPGQNAVQFNGQPSGGTQNMAGIVRPDGYIAGRPNDGNPQPSPPPRPNNVAMAPAAPLLPGEYREDIKPPKPDPDEEAKEKKKHPYDKVKIDHDQEDWALRNATRREAAISRSIHVDCYPDRVVLAADASGEPRVVYCNNGRRDADKLVAAVWEIMDTWGMAGKEMYWRPILNFYVVPGAEPRMLDITRSLEGSGLAIARKQ